MTDVGKENQPKRTNADEDTEKRVLLGNEPEFRKTTGDPELDELWLMSLDELQQIADNSEHALNTKANQVIAEAMKPLEAVARDILKPIVDSISKPSLSKLIPQLDFSKYFPKVDTNSLVGIDTAKWASHIKTPKIDLSPVLAAYDSSSWASQFAKNFPKFEIDAKALDAMMKVRAVVPTAPMPSPIRLPEFDYSSAAAPNITASQLEEVSEVKAHEIRDEIAAYFPEMLGHLGQLVNEARAARDSSKSAGAWNKLFGWSTVLAALASVTAVVLQLVRG